MEYWMGCRILLWLVLRMTHLITWCWICLARLNLDTVFSFGTFFWIHIFSMRFFFPMSLFPLLLALAPTVVHTCGGFFCRPQQPVVQSAETIVFGVKQKENDDKVAVTMSVQIEYEGPTENFSWLLPVPAVPNVNVGTDVLFARLMEATNPTFELEIKQDPLESLSPEEVCQSGPCARIFGAESEDSDGDGSALVVDSGSAGPFDFVVIESPEGDNDAAFRWLNDNGFDQPEMAGPLINYYAVMGMKFVAVKLSKNNDAGDIQPIVLQYELDGDVLNDALACVPIKLTAVAAAAALPVQVFLLGPHRAVPVNYLEAEMDLELVDWLGCTGSANCFLNDHRARANAVFSQLQGKAFTTEFSGETSTFANNVGLDIDLEAYRLLETPEEYFEALQRDNVPYTNQVHGIVSDYVHSMSVSRLQSGSFCLGRSFTFPPFGTQVCVGGSPLPPTVTQSPNDTVVEAEAVFDAVGLTEKLDKDIYQVLQQDEEWLLSHSTLTRMYGNFAGPDDMTKDPFFAFRSDLPDVSNIHRASAVPVCQELQYSLNFTVDTTTEVLSFRTDAGIVCGSWVRLNSNTPLFNTTVLTARKLVAQGFGQESSRFVQMTAGVLDLNDLGEVEAMLDGRVPSQVLPEWTGEATTASPMITPPPSVTEPGDNTTDEPASRSYSLGSAVVLASTLAAAAATVLV